jgi:hypothetical protein
MPVAVLVVAFLIAAPLSAQAAPGSAAAPAPAPAAVAQGPVDFQGIWDFTMLVGERTSPGFLALGPVEDGWAGSITMYLTNTLAIRRFTVEGDSLAMVVASREGDVIFRARLSDDDRTMRGIVEYHGGARLPMVAVRRAQPVAPQ